MKRSIASRILARVSSTVLSLRLASLQLGTPHSGRVLLQVLLDYDTDLACHESNSNATSSSKKSGLGLPSGDANGPSLDNQFLTRSHFEHFAESLN